MLTLTITSSNTNKMRPYEFIYKNVQEYLAKFPGCGESHATILSIIDYLEYQHELSIQNTLMATKTKPAKKAKAIAKAKKVVKKTKKVVSKKK